LAGRVHTRVSPGREMDVSLCCASRVRELIVHTDKRAMKRQRFERSMFMDLDDGGDDVAGSVQDVCPLNSCTISLWILTVQCSDLQGDRLAGGQVGRHVDFRL
jgi:hypothetical protein